MLKFPICCFPFTQINCIIESNVKAARQLLINILNKIVPVSQLHFRLQKWRHHYSTSIDHWIMGLVIGSNSSFKIILHRSSCKILCLIISSPDLSKLCCKIYLNLTNEFLSRQISLKFDPDGSWPTYLFTYSAPYKSRAAAYVNGFIEFLHILRKLATSCMYSA